MIQTTIDAQAFLAIPYVEGGRMVDGQLPLGGWDCWGLVVEARRRAGLWTPDPWGCGPKPVNDHPDGLPEDFERHLVQLEEPEPWCAVQLRSHWAGGHAGVYLPEGKVLHVSRVGARCNRFDKLQRRGFVLGIYRLVR